MVVALREVHEVVAEAEVVVHRGTTLQALEASQSGCLRQALQESREGGVVDVQRRLRRSHRGGQE